LFCGFSKLTGLSTSFSIAENNFHPDLFSCDSFAQIFLGKEMRVKNVLDSALNSVVAEITKPIIKMYIARDVVRANLLQGCVHVSEYDRGQGIVRIEAFTMMSGRDTYLLTPQGAFHGEYELTPVVTARDLEKIEQFRQIILWYDHQLGERLFIPRQMPSKRAVFKLAYT
jgi:hypothetical protein